MTVDKSKVLVENPDLGGNLGSWLRRPNGNGGWTTSAALAIAASADTSSGSSTNAAQHASGAPSTGSEPTDPSAS